MNPLSSPEHSRSIYKISRSGSGRKMRRLSRKRWKFRLRSMMSAASALSSQVQDDLIPRETLIGSKKWRRDYSRLWRKPMLLNNFEKAD